MTPADDELDIGPRGLLRHGLTRSIASLVIKIATAGLTYVMFVLLSRTMTTLDYGQFAFGFSLATMLVDRRQHGPADGDPAVLAGGHRARATPQRPATTSARGWALTLIAGATHHDRARSDCGAVRRRAAATIGAKAHLMAAACLILPMGAAEYASSALRAQGSVWTALAPRDIVWRLVLPLSVVGLFGLGVSLAGWQALILAALA